MLDRGRDAVVVLGPRRGRLASVNVQAVARRSDGVATVPAPLVRSVVARGKTLTGEQTDMLRRLIQDGDGVAIVVGRAGTGKTFALDAAREAWTEAGIRVQGAALAARAARELQDSAGIPSTTIHRLLAAINKPDVGSPLPTGSVLVVDEAGMVGTRMLARLLLHTAQQHVKVVLVGDPAQLPEIDAGGLFRALTARLPAVELTHNLRQTQPWEVEALDQLRHGDPAEAITAYQARGRIITGDTAEAVREQLVADWWEAYDRVGATSAVMVAFRRADVDDLNTRARARLLAAGHLTGPALDVHGVRFQAGDRIVCLRNDRQIGLVNGTRATISSAQLDRAGVATAAGGLAWRGPQGRGLHLAGRQPHLS